MGTCIEPGTEAPDFEVDTLAGERVQISKLRGQLVWIGFSRWAACPICNYRIHQMVAEWPRRYAGRSFRHINIFPSKPEKMIEYVVKQEPPFDLVPDPEEKLYGVYGLEASVAKGLNLETLNIVISALRQGLGELELWDGPAFRVPADFLIDRDGIIRVAHYGRKITENIPFDTVDAWLDEHGG